MSVWYLLFSPKGPKISFYQLRKADNRNYELTVLIIIYCFVLGVVVMIFEWIEMEVNTTQSTCLVGKKRKNGERSEKTWKTAWVSKKI